MYSKLINDSESLELKSLDSISTIVAGGTPTKKIDEYFAEKGIAWITPKDLSIQKSMFISHGEIDITELGLAKSSAKMMPPHSVVFSSRAPIGYIAVSSNAISTNQGFKSLVPDKGYSEWFLYSMLISNKKGIETIGSGSTFKEVSGTAMKEFEALIPAMLETKQFDALVKPLFEKIQSNELESKELKSIRDSLLPKLLSGDIELN